MAEYIDRETVLEKIESGSMWERPFGELYEAVQDIPSADVVPKSLYDQTAWERDLAIKQLREDYGVGLGEKKKDGAQVRHGNYWRRKNERQ